MDLLETVTVISSLTIVSEYIGHLGRGLEPNQTRGLTEGITVKYGAK